MAVEGEAGIGKTRLVEELVGHARERGAKVLAGRCYERELGAPLEPVLEALGSLPDEPDPAEAAGEYSEHPWKAVSHEDGARLHRSLAGRLIEESREGREGTVLSMDDVQWADPATLEFLSYLARRLAREKVLLVFTYRREDAAAISGFLDRLAERRDVSTLSLSRLALEDTSEIVGRMSSRSFGELGALSEFLQRESEGNPFYTVEYLRWLIETCASRG